MFGIENITNNNGWAMAVVGATTVFIGLAVLSFVISQIHKILELWENRGKKRARPAEPPEKKEPVFREQRLPTAQELCSIYRPLVEQLKEPFDLMQLFEKTKEMSQSANAVISNKLRASENLLTEFTARQPMFEHHPKP